MISDHSLEEMGRLRSSHHSSHESKNPHILNISSEAKADALTKHSKSKSDIKTRQSANKHDEKKT